MKKRALAKQMAMTIALSAFTSGAAVMATVSTLSNTGTNNEPTRPLCFHRETECAEGDTDCLASAKFIAIPCNDARCIKNPTRCAAINFSTSRSSQKSSEESESSSSSTDAPMLTIPPVPSFSKSSADSSASSESSSDRPWPPVLPPPTFNPDRVNNQGSAGFCYDKFGDKTTDRSQCDQAMTLRKIQGGMLPSTGSNSSAAASVPTEAASSVARQEEHVIEQKIEVKFFPDEEKNRHLSALLDSASNALQRMENLSGQGLNETAMSAITEMSDWLKNVLRDFSTGDPGVREIQATAGELKERLQATQLIVASSMPRKPKLNPVSLIERLEPIIKVIPKALVIFGEEGVDLPSDAIDAYWKATELFTEVKPLCLANADECLRLREVISQLETMRSVMNDAMEKAGKPQIGDKIDTLLQ